MQIIDIKVLLQRHRELKTEDIKYIQEWMSLQPHLPTNVTDVEIAIFLHANYFSIEASKTMIDNFYSYRTYLPHCFSSRDITGEDLVATHDIISYFLHPKRTPSNHQVLMFRFKDNDPTKFNFINYGKLINFALETELLEQGPADGVHYIIDLSGAKIGHILRVSITEARASLLYLQEALPIRIAGFHFINGVSIIDKILSIVKPFAKSDFAQKIFVHNNIDELSSIAPMEYFPNDYDGGKEDSFENLSDKYYQYLVDRREYFLNDEKTRRINNDLRPEKSQLVNELFGVEGSFKKLEID